MRWSAMARFVAKVIVQADGCWHWTGARNVRGYGYFRHPEKYAHRAAVSLFVGPIPPGMTVDHRCMVTHCVNPAHLDVVTQAENQRRYWSAVGPWSACVKVHPDAPSRVSVKSNGRAYCRECNRIGNRRRLGLPPRQDSNL